MKILKSFVSTVMFLAIGFGGYVFGFSRSTPEQIISNPVDTIKESVSKATGNIGKDNFEVSFEGKSGIAFQGSYSISTGSILTDSLVIDSFDVSYFR
jgi:hypothetical protein